MTYTSEEVRALIGQRVKERNAVACHYGDAFVPNKAYDKQTDMLTAFADLLAQIERAEPVAWLTPILASQDHEAFDKGDLVDMACSGAPVSDTSFKVFSHPDAADAQDAKRLEYLLTSADVEIYLRAKDLVHPTGWSSLAGWEPAERRNRIDAAMESNHG